MVMSETPPLLSLRLATPRHQTKNKPSAVRRLLALSGVCLVVYVASLVSLTAKLPHLGTSRLSQTLSQSTSDYRQQSALTPSRSFSAASGHEIYDWSRHASEVEQWLRTISSHRPKSENWKPIKAFIEPPLNATIPGTGKTQPESEGRGIPPSYYEPLPLRTQSPEQLQEVTYPRAQSCLDIPSKLPVDRGFQLDPITGMSIVTNTGDQPTAPDYIKEQLPFCPVDADPYLPWIHDVFLDEEKESIQFVAQNKRRCQTGSLHEKDLERLEPQVALLQSVSLQRITPEQASHLAPDLWQQPHHKQDQRYRLAPYSLADDDLKYTRFICRFHTWNSSATAPSSSTTENYRIELGETLSEHDFNYELAAFRKRSNSQGLLSRNGKDNQNFWTSTLMFSCPLPPTLKSQPPSTIQWTTTTGDVPLFHVDVIPIRTPARYPITRWSEKKNAFVQNDGFYLSEELIGPEFFSKAAFNATQAWGTNHVLPAVEASGRWENLPICPVSHVSTNADDKQIIAPDKQKTKPHLLSACLWAAASFHTRGNNNNAVNDTRERLKEWIEFHLLVGFDHIYIYDNSGAFGNETDLTEVTNLYPPSQVTRIDWPSQVCNNNIPAHDNTGERSSQYAAENSCRKRFGSQTEWIAFFDTDEYLIPQGVHTSLRTVVEDAKDSNILSFRSSRGKMRHSYLDPATRTKAENSTYLQAYNCDGSPTPRPSWAVRARKQLYRSDYVLNHFVHYSTVTKGYMWSYKDATESNQVWSRYYEEKPPSEREINEVEEAMMIHAKHIDRAALQNWDKRCRFDFKRKWLGCFVGFPWPNNTQIGEEGKAHDPATGRIYNCYVNNRVDSYWIPRLQDALTKRNTMTISEF